MQRVRGRAPRERGSREECVSRGRSQNAWLEKGMASAVLLLIPLVPIASLGQRSVRVTTLVRACRSRSRRAGLPRALPQAARQRTTLARPVRVVPSTR